MKKSVSKEDLPKFLSGKQIKALLLDNHDNIKDQDLADFTRDFYHRLSSANLKRESFDRNENNRRLDAMSRLLVGNETCAAVAFDGTNLLISTNENKHHGNRINTTINFLIKEHDSGVDQYYFYPIIYMSLTDREPVRIQIKTPAIYYYKEKDFSLNLTSSSPRKIDATLQLGQHLLLGLPAVPMGPLITIKEKVLLKELIETNLPTRLADRERYKFFKNDIANRPNKELEVEGPLLSSPINSLQRRAEILTKHLVNIALLEKSHNDNKQKYIDKIDDYRKIVLMNSLVWEASKWYSKEFKESGATLRGFLNSKATGINKFIKVLNNHFTIFKAAEENKFLGTLALVENWLTQVIALTNSSQITAPAFIKNNIDSFADKAKQYFIDLHKLEEFIKEEVVNDTALAKAFLNQGRNLAKAFVEHGSLDIDPTDSFIKNN